MARQVCEGEEEAGDIQGLKARQLYLEGMFHVQGNLLWITSFIVQYFVTISTNNNETSL